MQQTPNYALKKIELADSPPDITVINPNWDTIDQKLKELEESDATHMADDTSHVRYGADTGTANVKAVTLDPAPVAYVEGMAVSFKNRLQNTGGVTLNVNGLGAKSVLKSNGTAMTSGSLKANSIYTVRYNGTAFILQGEGGEYGNVTANDVRKGKTFGSDNGVLNGALDLSNLVPSNIKSGVIIDDVVGNYNDGVSPGETIAASIGYSGVTTSKTPVERKSILFNAGGTYRISFAMHSNVANNTAYGQIYKNGSPVGIQRATNSTTSITYTEEITVMKGESLAIYQWVAGSTGTPASYLDSLEVKWLAPVIT